MIPKDTCILIVDDSPTARGLIRGMLAELGLNRAHEADSVFSALHILKEAQDHNEPIQLILCDWNMPGMTGLHFLEKVRSSPIYGQTPFVMITTEGDFTHVKLALERGVSQYLTKPVKPEVLKEKINFAFAQAKRG